MMFSLPLIALMLVASCHCAPYKILGGVSAGGESRTDLTGGGSAIIKRDGLAFTADATSAFGGQLQGKGYGGGYANLNGKQFSGRGAVSGGVAGAIEPNLHSAFGIKKNGDIPLSFKPGVGFSKSINFDANGEIAAGEDANHLRKLFAPPTVDV